MSSTILSPLSINPPEHGAQGDIYILRNLVSCMIMGKTLF